MYPEYAGEKRVEVDYREDECIRDVGEVTQRVNETDDLLGELAMNIESLTKVLSPILHQNDTKNSGINSSVPVQTPRSPLAQKLDKTNDKVREQIARIYEIRNRVAL